MLLKKLKNIEESFLKEIYVESEFIDPADEILERSKKDSTKNHSIPFVTIEAEEIVSFFTIESSNPSVTGIGEEKGTYWLESFFLAKNFIGKGYSKKVIKVMLQMLPAYLPTITNLSLTVNIRNEVARKVYIECGFKDTMQQYDGGPAGPQFIYQRIFDPMVDSDLP